MRNSDLRPPKRQKASQNRSKSDQKHQKGSKKAKLIQSHQEKKSKKDDRSIDEKQCFICRSSYNLNRKLPVIVCSNNHTFCLNCIVLSIKALKLDCPMCRSRMKPDELNKAIYEQLLAEYKQKNKNLDLKLVRKEFTKLAIKKFSKKISSFDDFQLQLKIGKVTKTKNDKEPSFLVLEPELKDKSKCSFAFSYFPSGKVQVSFGVCIYDKFLLKVVQNCGFDTKIIDYFSKRDFIIKRDPKKGLRIVLQVDLIHHLIHWFSSQENKTQKGSQEYKLISSQHIQINQKVGDLAYYPYCVLYNVNDSIHMNK